ncbi:hypothetical protein HJD18_10575 [Thermoleophilia bacterium SCSIO 60948]|nr:hypothetical protein HJD18_10575 [Thermoleophilia bacterium SCSIO 60948]
MQGEQGDARRGRAIRARIALALATALAAVAAAATLIGLLGAPAVAGEDERLLPDMVTLRLHDTGLSIDHGKKTGRTKLELDNAIANKGAGPLEITASAEDGIGPCAAGDYRSIQAVYSDSDGSGSYEPGVDVSEPEAEPFGCMSFHPKVGHQHWHVLNLTHYQLLSWRRGTEVAEVRKQGFCLLDYGALPGQTSKPVYRGMECGGPGEDKGDPPLPPGVEGISIGFYDLYGRGLAGQSINITDVPAGRYCLSSTVDPNGVIAETNDANNARLTPVQIAPRIERVTKLPGTCPET